MMAFGALAAFYDELTRDVPYEAFADYYERLFAGQGDVKLLLDLGCGTGTLCCIMAQRGYELIAADSSADMLMAAAEKAARLNIDTPPILICQRADELDLYGTVDAAYSSLDSINYIPAETLPEVFRRLALFIRPGRLLVFDIRTPGFLRSMDESLSVDETEDLLCLWRGSFDEANGALTYDMDLFIADNGVWLREKEEHIEYAHEPTWLCKLLTDSGFTQPTIRSDGPGCGEGRLFISAIRGEY